MKSFLKVVTLAGVGAALAACAEPVKTAPVTAALEPAEVVAHPVGTTWVEQVGSKKETTVLAGIDGNILSRLNETSGCQFTTVRGSFSPGTTWRNCSGSEGTQELVRSGSIFPLTVGAKESWAMTGKNTKGDTWENVRNCEVTGTARVAAPIGTYDTYHVRCEDKWNVRDYYYSPEIGTTVIFRKSRKDRNEVETRELISIAPGAST